MGVWAFIGGFLAVALGIGIVYGLIRAKVRGFSKRIFGNPNLLQALEEVDSVGQDTPRSVNGCDGLLLPQILKDFPDFDTDLAKTYARDALRKHLSQADGLIIHRVVISQYLRSAVQKTIVFQIAAGVPEAGKTVQKRYDLHYTYLLSSSSETVAANCPNCGGALGYGVTVCPYCGSRVANVLGNTWEFTEIRES